MKLRDSLILFISVFYEDVKHPFFLNNESKVMFFFIFQIEEGDRGQDMTASPDNSGADRNGANNRNDDGVYTVSVTGAYDNQGFKGDGNNDCPKKPPREITDEEASQQGKFKLSTKEKWRILKNVSAISCAFMIQFTAFQGTANLQSSINAKDGLGTVSLCAIYAALVVSCIFVPTFLIKKLTVKWTLCLSLMCYAPYIGSQFYPKFYTLVPAGVLLGIGAAPMWASKATYLTQVAGVYAKLTDQAVDGIIVRFFGFFFLAWQTAELWGNLISSLGKSRYFQLTVLHIRNKYPYNENIPQFIRNDLINALLENKYPKSNRKFIV